MFLDYAYLDRQLSGMSADQLHELVVTWRSAQCDHSCPHCGTCVRIERGEGCLSREISDEVVTAAAEEQALREAP